ncbi:MAG: DUF5666 domain-containing protein [Candidatus Limnocylindrales bacterium]
MTDPTPRDPLGDPAVPPVLPAPPTWSPDATPADTGMAAPTAAPDGPTFYATVKSPPVWRIAIVALSGVALLVSAAVVIGASPAPSAGAGASGNPPAASGALPGGHAGPGLHGFGPEMGGPGLGGAFGGPFGGLGRQITISAIDGSNVTLKTADGWTRTIVITSSTKLTKGGQTIVLGDLKVGDAVSFQQTRNSDGTYTVTAVQVIVPTVSGSVSAVSDSGFTLKGRDGTTWTVTVTGSTTYQLGSSGAAGSKADVEVGSQVVVQGPQGSGNELTALTVHVQQAQVVGEVTAKSSTSITIKRADGTTQTIKVGSGTTYRVAGVTSATLADVTVGMRIVAEGTQNSDGSLSASGVFAGSFGPKGFPGPRGPKPSSTPSGSSTNG